MYLSYIPNSWDWEQLRIPGSVPSPWETHGPHSSWYLSKDHAACGWFSGLARPFWFQDWDVDAVPTLGTHAGSQRPTEQKGPKDLSKGVGNLWWVNTCHKHPAAHPSTVWLGTQALLGSERPTFWLGDTEATPQCKTSATWLSPAVRQSGCLWTASCLLSGGCHLEPLLTSPRLAMSAALSRAYLKCHLFAPLCCLYFLILFIF